MSSPSCASLEDKKMVLDATPSLKALQLKDIADVPVLINSHFKRTRRLTNIPIDLKMLIPSRHNFRQLVPREQMYNPPCQHLTRNSCKQKRNQYFCGSLQMTTTKHTTTIVLSIICWIMICIPHKLSSRAQQAIGQLRLGRFRVSRITGSGCLTARMKPNIQHCQSHQQQHDMKR